MPDGSRRSREHWTDSMEAGPPNPPAHVHRLPRFVRVALAGLLAAVFLCLVGIGLMAGAVYQANQYVQGRGEFRDRETARVEAETTEAIRRAMCDLLDTLPEGGLLERPRAKYGCGPGIPFDSLTPEEQRRINGGAEEPPPSPPMPLRVPSDTNQFRPAPTEDAPPGPTRPTPVPSEPSPTPPSVVGPLVGQVCDLSGVCVDIEEE